MRPPKYSFPGFNIPWYLPVGSTGFKHNEMGQGMSRPSEKSRNQEEEAKSAAPPPADRGISRWKLALGAASLFFFVVGVKRSFRTDDGREILQSDADRLDEQREQAKLASRNSAAGNSPSGAKSRTKDEAGSRSAKGGRMTSLLETAERDGRSSRETVQVRKSEKDSRAGRATRRAPEGGRGRSR